jgi:hypothetical protein
MSKPELVAPATADAAEDAAPLDISMLNNCPPTPPPTSPAIEFPIGPKLKFFKMAPAMLPPTAPLISWIIKAIIVFTSLERA